MKEKIKKFYNEHKVGIWVAGITTAFVGLACIGAYIYEKGKKYGIDLAGHEAEGKEILKALQGDEINDDLFDSVINACTSGKNAREIDESVFTEVAPKIENLLLWDDTTKETTFEKFYNVLVPLNGDPKEGLFKVTKKLVVSVADVGVEEVSCDQA